MQLKSVIAAFVLALSVTSCSTVSKVVYRIDVPQGNYLEESKVSQLRVGMTKEQVQYLLGTPLVTDPFGSNTWYYVYLEQKGYQDPVQHTLVVNLDQKGVVSSFDLDKPLPTDENKANSNTNTIINATEEEKSAWWKLWKSNKDATAESVEEEANATEKAAQDVAESTQAVVEKAEQKVEEVKQAIQPSETPAETSEQPEEEKSWWKFW